MFTDKDLFRDGVVDASSCNIMDGDGDGVPDSRDNCPDTPYALADQTDDHGCTPPTEAPSSYPTAPTTSPTPAPTDVIAEAIYQAEADGNLWDGTSKISDGNLGFTSDATSIAPGYLNMGGQGSWVEW